MSALVGTGGLTRLILRRDRVLLPLWVLFLSLVPLSFVSTFSGLYPTAGQRRQFADASEANAGFVALYGRLFGSNLGELVTWRSGFIPIMIGLFSVLTVIRHTRTEEESGRRELIGATVVGRQAGLAAALLVTFAANLALGTVLTLGMVGRHLPTGGSIAFGLQFAAAGLVFTALGGLTAQLTENAGTARVLAIVVLGASYLLKVVGELSAHAGGAFGWVSWLSPLGWVHLIRPYDHEQWWVLALVLALTALLTSAAGVLSARRDVGAGLLAPRLGPATAGGGLRSPLALAWVLHRGSLAGWVAGFAALGIVFGGVAKSIGDMLGDNQALRDIFVRLGGSAGLVDAYFASIMGILGLIASAQAIQASLKIRTEEIGSRAEPVLAAAVGRMRWAASHLVFSILGPAVILLVAGAAAGLTYGLTTGDVGREVPRVLGAAMLQLPAVWVVAAISIALIGLLPRLAAAGWGVLGVFVLVGLVGGALRLSHWLVDISPFTHIPRVPGGSVSVTPLIVLVVVAVVVAAVGLAGLRRRGVPA